MGLDMDAYSTVADEYQDEVDFNVNDIGDRLQYWRKHNALHRFMNKLYKEKGGKNEEFNCSALNINTDDLLDLLVTIRTNGYTETDGFFFGSDSSKDDRFLDQDLEFIDKATTALEQGKKVYYVASY